MFASPGAIVFQFGTLAVRWYGLLIATASMLGPAWRTGRRSGVVRTRPAAQPHHRDGAERAAGALLYYVLSTGTTTDPAAESSPSGRGLAIHGGSIAGALATLIYCRVASFSVPLTMDILVPGWPSVNPSVGGGLLQPGSVRHSTILPWKLYNRSVSIGRRT